ncbi:MAG TPA: hypothetical protein VK633_01660, partial [Verrucomicrobiae bacterium]|nr:hypothetical protein [Verrucomicrobiae bacterium]
PVRSITAPGTATPFQYNIPAGEKKRFFRVVIGGAPPQPASPPNGAIPAVAEGSTIRVTLDALARTYRQIVINGGPNGRTIQIPPVRAAPSNVMGGDVGVQVFAVQPYNNLARHTEILIPLSGSLTIPPNRQERLLLRIFVAHPSAVHDTYTRDLGFVTISARVDGNLSFGFSTALPMLAWVNVNDANNHGVTPAQIETVLGDFGVNSTGVRTDPENTERQLNPVRFYFSAAFEAATRAPISETADQIVAAEERIAAQTPFRRLWVQVSDEQDASPQSVQGTVDWIRQLRAELKKRGPRVRLFVAAMAQEVNKPYAAVIDAWATTQQNLAPNRNRDFAIQLISAARNEDGQPLELFEYPGANAFFDRTVPAGPALSVASAGIDGASTWFYFSANNLSNLERPFAGCSECVGDIGGLVVVQNGHVLPTFALAQIDYAAGVAAVYQMLSPDIRNTPNAQQIAQAARQADAGMRIADFDFRAWEDELFDLWWKLRSGPPGAARFER